MDFFTTEKINELSPEERIINSLKSGKFQGGGQSLYRLIKVAYMEHNEYTKRSTQRILQKLKKKNMVCYFKETNVWYWTGEE